MVNQVLCYIANVFAEPLGKLSCGQLLRINLAAAIAVEADTNIRNETLKCLFEFK